MLPDGTLIKINRTTVADKDGFGNHFFFQSTFSHSFGDEKDQPETAEAAESTPPELEEEAELLESFDPSLNEIDDGAPLPKDAPTADVFGIDAGLED